MIRAVIFDWGDVVAPNAGGGWVRALAQLLSIDFDDALAIWRVASPGLSRGNKTEAEFWEIVSRQIEKPLPENAQDIWIDGLAREPYPEMLEYIEHLKSEGIRTAVLSNSIEPMEHCMDFDRLFSIFDVRVFSHKFGYAKPDPDVYIHTLELLTCKADESVFIDDQQANVDAANNLGMHGILSSKNPAEDIEAVADLIQHREQMSPTP